MGTTVIQRNFAEALGMEHGCVFDSRSEPRLAPCSACLRQAATCAQVVANTWPLRATWMETVGEA